MHPISTIVVLVCGVIVFNSFSSGVEGSDATARVILSLNSYRYYTYRIVRYNKYRYTVMNRMKYYYRAYSSSYNFGAAALYQRTYSYAARLSGYSPSTSFARCGNFETNSYGDFIGYFGCPLFFEPASFSYCCGKQKHHFCCNDSTKATPYTSDPGIGNTVVVGLTTTYIVLIAFGAILGFGGLITLIICIVCCKAASKRPAVRPMARPTVTHSRPVATVTVVQRGPANQWTTAPGAYPMAQPPSQYPQAPYPQPQSYPPPQPVYPPQSDPAYPPPPPPATSGVPQPYYGNQPPPQAFQPPT